MDNYLKYKMKYMHIKNSYNLYSKYKYISSTSNYDPYYNSYSHYNPYYNKNYNSHSTNYYPNKKDKIDIITASFFIGFLVSFYILKNYIDYTSSNDYKINKIKIQNNISLYLNDLHIYDTDYNIIKQKLLEKKGINKDYQLLEKIDYILKNLYWYCTKNEIFPSKIIKECKAQEIININISLIYDDFINNYKWFNKLINNSPKKNWIFKAIDKNSKEFKKFPKIDNYEELDKPLIIININDLFILYDLDKDKKTLINFLYRL